jgi:hypothetical protein
MLESFAEMGGKGVTLASSRGLAALLGAAIVIGCGGCIDTMMVDAELRVTRRASGALDTVGDFEVARDAATASIAQLEGMHLLSPHNSDGLFMLTKAWAGLGYAFIEDEMEAAEDRGDEAAAAYERRRAHMAYDRAIFYALQLLHEKSDGFEQARKSGQTITRWLDDNFTTKSDALDLFWTAYPWLARINLMKGDDDEGPPLIAELYVGVAMLERAVALDAAVEHYLGMLALGAYHARTSLAEVDQAKTMLDTVLARTENKALVVQFTYATSYACVKGDGALYQDLLGKVLQGQDSDPHRQLENTIAKRRAARWLGRARARDECGIALADAGSAR